MSEVVKLPNARDLKEQCPDCFQCQMCGETRCSICRKSEHKESSSGLDAAFTHGEYLAWKTSVWKKRNLLKIKTKSVLFEGDGSMAESVKLYTLSTCGHCKSTKTLLNDCAVKYDFTDVDLFHGDERAAILEDVKKWNPNCSFPTIIIGDKVIVGYKEEEIKEALGI